MQQSGNKTAFEVADLTDRLRLSKPLFHSELRPIHYPSDTSRLIDWLWAQVMVKVDREKLGNVTAFTWPCFHREPVLIRENLDFRVDEDYFIRGGQYLGHAAVEDILARLQPYSNKHCHENAQRVVGLLQRLLQYARSIE